MIPKIQTPKYFCTTDSTWQKEKPLSIMVNVVFAEHCALQQVDKTLFMVKLVKKNVI